MQILSQRPDVPFRRGTEKLLMERKTEHDRLKKTNLIVTLQKNRLRTRLLNDFALRRGRR
jgi:hypothetical protein